MKIMVISDLHIDINRNILKKENFGFLDNMEDVDLVLNCGDISGLNCLDVKFLNTLKNKILDENLKTRVYTINGNHSWYEYDTEGICKTAGILKLRERFQFSPVEFLENNCSIVGDYIIFGCTLYTDFDLYKTQEHSKSMANQCMNDFRYVYDYNCDGEINRITPYDYVKSFKNSIKILDEICNSYPNKKIIVLTHFAPSEQSITPEYVGNSLNPAYASNLEEFILKHKNIVVWAHGHIHGSSDYNIGQCKVICESYGYYGYEQSKTPNEYFGKIIEI